MIFQIVTAISAIISLLLTIYVFNMKNSKNTVIFAMLMLQITIFTSGSFMELWVKETTANIVWRNISQVGFLSAIPTLLILIIVYIGKEENLKPVNIIVIYIFPAFNIMLRWTDRYSHLAREDIYIEKGQLVVISTPFALFFMLSELTIILFSVVLLLSYCKKINVQYKKQTFIMAAGILIPFLTSILGIIRPGSNYNSPLISIAFTLTGIIIFWGIFRYQLFSTVPITRDKIMDCIQEGIITADKAGIIIDKNNAVDKFISDTFGEKINLMGEKLEDFLFAWPRWYLACKNMQKDEFEIDTLKWGKQKFYYVKVYPLFENELKKQGTVSVLIDITDRKIREEKLFITSKLTKDQMEDLTGEINRQKKQMETIVSTVSDMAYLSISDKAGNFLYHNNVGKGLYTNHIQIISNKLITTYQKGLYYYQDGSEIDIKDMPVFRVLRGEKLVNFHFIMKNSGQDSHLLFNGTPIYDKNGSLSHGVYFILDITDNIMHQKLISITEHLTEMNALKDKLFTVFTHDIRNPIATMVSLVDMMEQDKEWYNQDFKEILDEVKKQVNYTYNIIENLLEWLNSQRDGLVFKPSLWLLAQIVGDTVSLYLINASVKGILINSNIDEKIKVYADKEMLELVLRNLLSNAVKFTEQGGSISIEAYETDTETIIAVKDTGIGMDKEKVQTLFQECYAGTTLGTAGEKGIGLGLLICKEFIMKGGGRIWAESIPGKGSTFYISLLTSNKK
ncbi:MAG: histidine kinase N-terminal 7TM domain-containing protein [Anaerocolumna sp.]